jgi:hypothetical protein
MPSIDEDLLLTLHESGKLVYRHPERSCHGDVGSIMSINTLDRNGNADFIHSGTYEELTTAFGFTPPQIPETVQVRVRKPVPKFSKSLRFRILERQAAKTVPVQERIQSGLRE